MKVKKWVKFLIVLVVLYFVVGLVFAKIGFLGFKMEKYLEFGTIFGGIASVVGLLSFVIPKFTSSDLREFELDVLKKIVTVSDDLKQKEEKLEKLKEMEFLVEKASMSLFTRDQLERRYERISEIISENRELSKLMDDIRPLENRLKTLNEEIEKNENAELLKEIMNKVKPKDPLDALRGNPILQVLRFLEKAIFIR